MFFILNSLKLDYLRVGGHLQRDLRMFFVHIREELHPWPLPTMPRIRSCRLGGILNRLNLRDSQQYKSVLESV